ncbi:DUF4249 domain-containing protein [Flavobacterium aquidurense]|uniref:DUF4249 domain-containing protein n=1 Tax=Flavobacterium aquidurense TaxID=362413 RepID=UPI0028571CDE|nr:DUF4249 domain-containing protein [Flavobacterium aquidurense]MDR7369422.1 hypothetical protein [Flavobacterium aquidurense]
MLHQKINNIILLILASILFNGCTETFPLLTNTYEEAIVVEATLTNELKNQQIKITKTSKLEDKTIQTETGAMVIVKDDQNNLYVFAENAGIYQSQSPFQILPDRKYTLSIKTKDGKIYESAPETLPTVSPITSVVPSIATNKDNETGIQINVNSYDPKRTSQYYRYEYEETYKIIAPSWSSLKVVATGPESVKLIENDPNTKTCYTTKNSTDILLVNTTDQSEDRINYPIRFIQEDNYIIGHRYSILVKQYVENYEAYSFHKIMRDIASSATILSPKQPGVISGNIKCITDSATKVIGYFDVTSVSEQRIFFNYSDFFPGKPAPYFNPCFDVDYLFCFSSEGCNGDSMIYNIEQNLQTYVRNTGIRYKLVDAVCGDCTTFSSNIIPPFWIN